MSAHTPGPWYDQPDHGSESFAFEIINQDRTGIALVYAYDTPSAANARLIAAAPELFEALRALVKHDATKINISQWAQDIDQAVDALNKAEGVHA